MISFKKLIGKKNESAQPEANEGKKQESIFGQTLNAGQVIKTKKAEYIETKNKRKAYATLGVSFVGLMVYSIFFFYGNTAAYLRAPAEIAKLQAQIDEYNDVILPSLEKTKDLHKSAYDQEFVDIIKSLEAVFPNEIDKLGIIRLFESFATEVAASFPPFEFTSISLAKPIIEDGYQVIPVSTSIYSSLAGFDKFLTLVDRSGYIYTGEGENKKLINKKIRLMSISNISIKYRGVDEATGEDKGVDFSVKLNIYSRLSDTNQNKK